VKNLQIKIEKIVNAVLIQKKIENFHKNIDFFDNIGYNSGMNLCIAF